MTTTHKFPPQAIKGEEEDYPLDIQDDLLLAVKDEDPLGGNEVQPAGQEDSFAGKRLLLMPKPDPRSGPEVPPPTQNIVSVISASPIYNIQPRLEGGSLTSPVEGPTILQTTVCPPPPRNQNLLGNF